MSIIDALELDGLREKAERWDALMSSGRMHFMGCAGFNLVPKDGDVTSRKTANLTPLPIPGTYMHFGMEFWDTHPAAGDPRHPDQFERDLLVAYVDAIRERKK